MFLDDKLLLICKEQKKFTPEGIQNLNVLLCRECENYYKEKIGEYVSNKGLKLLLDRTFNLFDSFVNMALKDDDNEIRIIGGLFKEHTFKKQLLDNNEMSIIYNSLI